MRANPEIVPFGPGHIKTYLDGELDTDVTIDSDSIGIYAYKRSYTSTSTPNFHELKRLKKALPFHSHQVDGVWDSGTPYEFHRWEDFVDEFDNPFTAGESLVVAPNTCYVAPGVSHDYGHITDALKQAESRLRSKVSGLTVNLAQALGERKQTARLLASSAERVLKIGVALRKWDLGAARRLLGQSEIRVFTDHFGRKVRQMRKPPNGQFEIANAWLEYKYGWKPLMQDIYGSIELLNKKIVSDGLSIYASGKGFSSTTSSPGNWPSWTSQKATTAKMRFAVKCEDELIALAGNSGISNPALLAWELIPFSFVVDWFIPVGNYLEGLTAYDGFTFKDGWTAQKTTGTYVANYRKAEDVSSVHLRASGLRQQRGYSYTRNPQSVPPLFPPSFRSPIGGDPLDRFATAMSLLKQTLRLK